MILRNGTQTDKSLEIYLPEDVWNIIKKEYLGIDDYWRIYCKKNKKRMKKVTDSYVSYMLDKFSDKCINIMDVMPLDAYNRKCYYLRQKYVAFKRLYELFIYSAQLFKIKFDCSHCKRQIIFHEKLLDTIKRKNKTLLRDIRDSLRVIDTARSRGEYTSKVVEKSLLELRVVIIEGEEWIEYYNL